MPFDPALIERALKDADRTIDWLMQGKPALPSFIDVRIAITAALTNLRQVPTPPVPVEPKDTTNGH